ncbi:helicase-related protein [Magnetospirillum sp. UT-4]|uniref:helicase-related protein n=1 Tax=Magnetospirillum sp. UT-4 TaxID=2681467 RepID=UPI00137CF0F3|nr:helicase-related protein [Magnetospirillum sp. UT-4]CAA7621242.1 Helicase, C-terminal [Magnetospirillum sp. UT-4]
MSTSSGRGRVLAVLGPTNTGKTHFALERMLGHASGMIGFPLRLLARENYDRIARAKGAEAVALITGEERIIPPRPRWFVCTVESMPLDRRVAFLAVDEIQLCADPERGHVFTDRLLNARGTEETVFLGAETIRPLLRRLVPGTEFVTRPRFSRLEYAGPRKLARLPSRAAVVAFSAAEVYAMAEFVRRQKGGAAVVLGALSPRTRNAQIGLFQAGEVDTIVATDAIGMGLNMDVDHVAFASLRKFDGRAPRPLAAAELAQIAGRAGRHMNDGTFGATADLAGIDAELVEAVENHAFPPLKALSWRNSELRFASVEALAASLERPPPSPGLVRAREADDQVALAHLARDPEVMRVANHPERVRLLWEVCQIPDFRKVMADSHTRLLGQVFRHLTGPGRRLPADWLANHIRRLDRTDGELDTLVARIAGIRTWTYVSHRADWVADAAHWQGEARAVEDRLSDALHERLTQRFVDRRTAVLVRAMREEGELLSAVNRTGEVLVEGQYVGRLAGFRFEPDAAEGASAARAVAAAAARALKSEIAARVARLAADGDEAFALGDDGAVLWRGEAVARLVPGAEPLRPQVEPPGADVLEPAARETIRRRLGDWLAAALDDAFRPLARARAAPLKGAARGLVHQLAEGLGSAARPAVAAQLDALAAEDRAALAALGIRFGTETVFFPALLKPGAQRVRAVLWGVRAGCAPPPPPGERVAVAPLAGIPAGFYEAVGYRLAGPRAVRADMLERFAAEARRLAREAPAGFLPPPALLSLLGLSATEAALVLAALGFRRGGGEAAPWLAPTRPKPAPRGRKPANTDSPFAVLRR